MTRLRRRTAWLLMLLCAAATPALAQGRGGGRPGSGRPGGGRMGRSSREGGRLGMPTAMSESTLLVLLNTFLTPTDEQQQRIHAVVDEAVTAAAPLAARLGSSKEQMFAAAKAGQSSEQLGQIAADQAAAASQILELQARTFEQIAAILTPAQRTNLGTVLYDDIGECLSTASASPGATATASSPVGAAASSPATTTSTAPAPQ